jgi:uncharacterized protein
MPNQQDQQTINGLFDRIEDVARNSPPRDREAERLIQQRLSEFPPAPYYLAQTVVMQEQALAQARARIAELEQQHPRGPWDRRADWQDQPARGQGGFLAGAAQTALGVSGGLLLGSVIAGMFGSGAHASEGDAPAVDDSDPGGADDFGDGGFDIGGDF